MNMELHKILVEHLDVEERKLRLAKAVRGKYGEERLDLIYMWVRQEAITRAEFRELVGFVCSNYRI